MSDDLVLSLNQIFGFWTFRFEKLKYLPHQCSPFVSIVQMKVSTLTTAILFNKHVLHNILFGLWGLWYNISQVNIFVYLFNYEN